jgi:hypothetical protein
VLAIAIFLMMSLFTVRVSRQSEMENVHHAAVISNQLAHSEQARRMAATPEQAPAEIERRAATGISFSSREGAPPEPLELPEPQEIELTDTETSDVSAASSPVAILTVSAERPAWVGAAPKRVGPVYSTVVVSDPYVSKAECDEAIDPQLRDVALRYVDDLLGSGARRFVDLDMSAVRTKMARDEYVELLDTSVGPMQRVHVLMEFDNSLRDEFRQQYQAGIRQRRLYQAGGGAVLLVGFLVVMFGYLTVDTATRGFYTRRLQLAAAAAILLIVVLGISLNRAI